MAEAAPFARVAVIGAGAWGTALAVVARRAGRDVRLLARSAERAAAINARHVNPAYLSDIALDPAIVATAEPAAAFDGAAAALVVVPAQHLRETLARVSPPATLPLLLCAKGIERGSGKLITEVAGDVVSAPLAVLSGPTFAREVARGLPTAVTVAASDAALGRRFVVTLGGPTFRPYLGDDPVGTQVAGAVKNVIAIACGIVAGRRLGDNARAALMTRGLAEITRLALALGGKAATLGGLSGLGDLALTCNNPQSRNMALGVALGEGKALAAAIAEARGVVEGVDSAESIAALARARGVDMPITGAVHAILHHAADIDSTLRGLLARPFTSEAS
jgi:glycerol-3-phosphate dehydrogenase (NAD(P)+)